MKLIKLKTKVLLTSESQMELLAEHDLGSYKDDDKKWVYRETAVIASEIYRIVQYSKTKTLVEMFGDEKYLVDEPFETIFHKWEKSKEDDDIHGGNFLDRSEENVDEDEE